jgi:C_GCAxxG_C_C family probable redox protein
MERADKAREIMAGGRMNCAQTVLSIFCEELGLPIDMALSLVQGFGGGMAHTGQTCGAVTGAYMVLGLAHKNMSANPRENVNKTYALMNEFNKKFVLHHKFLNCGQLTGYDLSTEAGLAAAREKKIFATICPGLVQDSVKILEGLLELK